MKEISLLITIFLFIQGVVYAQNWQQIQSVDDVCNAYPKEMNYIFENLNMDYPGLEEVSSAWEKGNLEEACKNLLEYYESGQTVQHLRKVQPERTLKTVAEADTILNDVFLIQNVRGQLPYLSDGHRDWYYKGPNNDREWAWLSNRHSQIQQVFLTYLETGNPKYARYIDLFLRDFIIKSMPYPGVKSSTSVWRGLEVSFRAKVWSQIFYGLLNSEYLLPATRLLMLSSLPDHAHYNRYFHAENNWLTMEISALATIATNFPEYKNSTEWLNYSIETMTKSMKGQVYNDGAQTELTSHYHITAMTNFELFKEICDRANRQLPVFFNETLEKMQNYLACTMRPNGTGILNNDGDLDNNRQKIVKAAFTFGRDDWKFIATNGHEGTKPEIGPSFFFPWAGHLISRSGYDAEAHWSFFDIGPWGSGHQHNDKMNITVSAYGRDLLVDAGRFAYTGEVAAKFRGYATGSKGHNVLLFDGKEQGPGVPVTSSPVSDEDYLITEKYDLARGSFENFIDLEGTCKHTRTLFYSRGNFWVVVDQVLTDRPRKVEALWHWHPECDVMVEGEKVTTRNEKGNLQIIPAGIQKWDIKLIKGQEEPEIQGWYSPEYNKFEPGLTTVCSTEIKSNDRFVWVLYPSEKAEKLVRAEIISETPKEIKVRITNEKKDEWVVDVPLK